MPSLEFTVALVDTTCATCGAPSPAREPIIVEPQPDVSVATVTPSGRRALAYGFRYCVGCAVLKLKARAAAYDLKQGGG